MTDSRTADRPAAEPRFDELIHPSTRLAIVSLLAAADWADFGFVRDTLQLSDSALSKQFATLQDAGYLTVQRQLAKQRHRVRVSLTQAGRAAFAGHVAALQQMLASSTAAGAGLAGTRSGGETTVASS